jgi:hypothetical protein
MATKGHSTKLEYGDEDTYEDSETFTALAKVTELGGISIEGEDIDVSHMESVEQFAEFDPGWADAGEVEATLQFEKTQNETVYGLFRQPKGFRMVFSEGSKWGFSGYIKGFSNEVERKGIVTAKVTIKISGKPVFVKAA